MSGALELQAVSRAYRDTAETVEAVKYVSLRVDPGEVVGLFGPSGSGKSTLLLIAAGILQPDEGSVTIGDTDLSTMSASQLSEFRLHEIGFVFQSFHLLPGLSAIDNVALPLMLSGTGRRSAHTQVVSLLDRVGLAPRARHLPGQLSGGERQRVAVAKALACNPRLILADEPTGNLDSQRSHDVLELLAAVAVEHDVATLLVSHDREAELYTNRNYHLRDGRLVDARSIERPSPSLELPARGTP